jgi:hypothetical protein
VRSFSHSLSLDLMLECATALELKKQREIALVAAAVAERSIFDFFLLAYVRAGPLYFLRKLCAHI